MNKFIYVFFTGLLIAAFIGMGISTFYPGPEAPEYPSKLTEPRSVGEEQTAEELAAQSEYEVIYDKFQEDNSVYNRNVSMIAVGSSVLLLVIGLVVMQSLPVIAEGALLGGLFTLIYGIIRSFMTEDSRFRFIIVAIGLVVVLAMGYLYFVKPVTAKKTSK